MSRPTVDMRHVAHRQYLNKPIAISDLRHFIKSVRRGRRMTQAQLARDTGYTHGIISLIETGKHTGLATILKFIEALGYDVQIIISRGQHDHD